MIKVIPKLENNTNKNRANRYRLNVQLERNFIGSDSISGKPFINRAEARNICVHSLLCFVAFECGILNSFSYLTNKSKAY